MTDNNRMLKKSVSKARRSEAAGAYFQYVRTAERPRTPLTGFLSILLKFSGDLPIVIPWRPERVPEAHPMEAKLDMQARIAELLGASGIVTAEAVRQAEEAQERNRTNIVIELCRMGSVDERRLTQHLAERFAMEWMELSDADVEEAAVALVPLQLLQKGRFVPFRCENATLFIAMCDPTDVKTVDQVRFASGLNVRVVLVAPSCIEQLLSHRFGALSYNAVLEKLTDDDTDFAGGAQAGPRAELGDPSLEAPAVALVNALLKDAVLRRASDIHVEPYEHYVRVRFRIDGVLHDIMHPPPRLKFALIARVKVLAGLDVTERRLPQDGRLQFETDGRQVDVRVSLIPALFGEKVVLRLLDRSHRIPQFAELGLSSAVVDRFQQALRRTFGLVLVTGPTGSGKTTTLYSILRELNRDGVNVSTVEDPVEYNLAGVNQVQVHADIGVSFAACLRSFLRQDPDIIMVGEIRDAETASIAIRAALTGHLVLSTLHTNDAPSSVHRLIDMGVEPYLAASSINVIAAQRLLRRICDRCRVDDAVNAETFRHLCPAGAVAGSVAPFRGAGCAECNHTGYQGRTAIFEVVTMFEGLKQAILRGGGPEELRRLAVAAGMRTLREEALEKVCEGVTSVEETVRMTSAGVVEM